MTYSLRSLFIGLLLVGLITKFFLAYAIYPEMYYIHACGADGNFCSGGHCRYISIANDGSITYWQSDRWQHVASGCYTLWKEPVPHVFHSPAGWRYRLNVWWYGPEPPDKDNIPPMVTRQITNK